MNTFIKLCRLCTSCEDVSLTLLNNLDSDDISFWNKLNEIAPEILEEANNELPNGICKICIVQLNDAYKFRKKCFRSQEILKQNLKQLQNVICEENEINLKNREDFDNFGSFEFINVDQLQNNKYLQETNESKIEEKKNIISNIKEEQIEERNLCNTEFESNYFQEENIADNSEAVKLINSETDTITKKESNLDCEGFVSIKSEINEESSNDISSENTKTDKHIESESNTVEHNYSCVICEESFSSILELTLHGNEHKGENAYPCKTCNKSFKWKSTLLEHNRTHTDIRPYKCCTCGKTYKRNEHLKQHIRTHCGKRYESDLETIYICEICGEFFNNKLQLKLHDDTHKDDNGCYTCKMCNKSFKWKSTLLKHNLIHTNTKPFKCPICAKAFKRNEHLKQHTRTHSNERPYECELCQKTFGDSSNLKRHFLTHTNTRPYKCQICDRAFSRNQLLRYHIRIHTMQM